MGRLIHFEIHVNEYGTGKGILWGCFRMEI